MRGYLTVLMAAMLGIAALPATAQEKGGRVGTIAFPGGAKAIEETHGDWDLTCGIVEQQKMCVLKQTLADRQTGTPLLSMEIIPAGAMGGRTVLTLPFDTEIGGGVQLVLGEDTSAAPLPISGCSESGCHAMAGLEAKTLGQLRSDTTFKLRTVARGTDRRMIYPASTNGFAEAHDRALELVR